MLIFHRTVGTGRWYIAVFCYRLMEGLHIYIELLPIIIFLFFVLVVTMSVVGKHHLLRECYDKNVFAVFFFFFACVCEWFAYVWLRVFAFIHVFRSVYRTCTVPRAQRSSESFSCFVWCRCEKTVVLRSNNSPIKGSVCNHTALKGFSHHRNWQRSIGCHYYFKIHKCFYLDT